MSLLLNFARVSCNNCGTEVTVNFADLDVQESGADERGMGAEIFYFGQFDFECPRCRSALAIEHEESEYPIGVPNFSDTQVQGARLIAGFHPFPATFDERVYDFDADSGILVPQERAIITQLGQGAASLMALAERDPGALYSVHPREFEQLVAHIFQQHGFVVELTKQTRDGGRDIIALKTDSLGIPIKLLVECKRYARTTKVGVEVVRALYGVHVHDGANKSIIVTTSSYTKAARAFVNAREATKQQIGLFDFEDLKRWLSNRP